MIFALLFSNSLRRLMARRPSTFHFNRQVELVARTKAINIVQSRMNTAYSLCEIRAEHSGHLTSNSNANYGGRKCDCGERISEQRRGTGPGATPMAISFDDISIPVEEREFFENGLFALRACLQRGIGVRFLTVEFAKAHSGKHL